MKRDAVVRQLQTDLLTRHSERARNHSSTVNPREIPHSADSVRNDGFFLLYRGGGHSQVRLVIGRAMRQRENGYMAQAMPTPTARKRKKDHRMYLTRSEGLRRPRKPKATEMTAAKSKNAWKWVKVGPSGGSCFAASRGFVGVERGQEIQDAG